MNDLVAEIFSQGDEIVTGEIVDTNAAWLSEELTALGFEVIRHTAVGDRLEALVELLREINRRADLCLCSGGLGPTCDDLTAEAAGIAFGLPLELDETALGQIEAWFARLGRGMPEANKKQALLPRGAERLDNLWGTAPGFALKTGHCRFVFLPGVPGEMKIMFGRWVRPDLVRSFKLKPARRVVLRTVGVGESALQERLDRVALPAGVRLGFRAGGAENWVKLLFPANFSKPEQSDAIRRVVETIGEAVYAVGGEDPGDSLETVVGRQLAARQATLYAVETASGGALANRCAGADWFAGAAVEPDPVRLLPRFDVPAADTLAATASRLAERVRAATGADYALVQYGAFDLDALRSETAQIEIEFALGGPFGSNRETSRVLGGGLARKKNTAASLALDFVRRCLMKD